MRTLATELWTGAAFASMRALMGATIAVPFACGAASVVIFTVIFIVERRDVTRESVADGV